MMGTGYDAGCMPTDTGCLPAWLPAGLFYR